MLLKKKYDLIFGIGEACSCSQILRKCRLQFFSYPFDWLFGSDILTRARVLTDNYRDFINYEDLEDFCMTNKDEHNLCEIYRNKKNDIHFNHDFAYGKPLSETYEAVRIKYDRRANRQISQIEKSKKILAVYVQTPDNRKPVDNNTLIEVYNTLKSRFPKQDINLLYLFCDHDKKIIKQETVQEGVYRFDFDYDAYNKELPYLVDRHILQRLFCKLKISTKFMTPKNFIRRCFYLTKCFFRRML